MKTTSEQLKMTKFSFFPVLLLINIITIWKISAATDDYFQLEIQKFQKDRLWLVDLVNMNNNHCFQGFFMFKDNAFCISFNMFKVEGENGPGLSILMIRNSDKYIIRTFFGQNIGNILYDHKETFNENRCPTEKRLEFVYTDYENVIVFKGGDSRSGPHVMVLRSDTTEKTFQDRMNLVKRKITHFLDFQSLKKVEPEDCKLVIQSQPTKLLKCKEFNEIKEREKVSDMIRKSLLLAVAASGILWIIMYGLCWFVKRKKKSLVAPAQPYF